MQSSQETREKNDPISSWMLLQPYPNKFPEGNKKWKLPHMARPQQSTLAEASTPYY